MSEALENAMDSLRQALAPKDIVTAAGALSVHLPSILSQASDGRLIRLDIVEPFVAPSVTAPIVGGFHNNACSSAICALRAVAIMLPAHAEEYIEASGGVSGKTQPGRRLMKLLAG